MSFIIYAHQILDLKKKQESQVQLLKQKQKSDEAAKRLQDEIQSIKAQKVKISCNITHLWFFTLFTSTVCVTKFLLCFFVVFYFLIFRDCRFSCNKGSNKRQNNFDSGRPLGKRNCCRYFSFICRQFLFRQFLCSL